MPPTQRADALHSTSRKAPSILTTDWRGDYQPRGVLVTTGSLRGRLTWAAVLVGIAGATLGGCGSPADQEPSCLPAAANLDCAPAYGLLPDGKTIAPTFQEVFDNTLVPSCALAGCHRAPNPGGGLQLDEIDTAYKSLLATNAQGERRVIPGDVTCGKVIVRLEEVSKPWSMPRGGHLDDRALCSIRHWIADKAPR
jgi:hypothetical protein